MIRSLAAIFKALGEPTRLKIVRLLLTQELYLCELAEVLDMSQPRVSQHIKVLKTAGIIEERKEGQRSFFSVAGQFAGGRVDLFQELMNRDLSLLGDFELEMMRINKLSGNSTVIECKNRSSPLIWIESDEFSQRRS